MKLLPQEKFYNHLITKPPLTKDNHRKRGCRAWEEFWRGYEGIPNRNIPGSFSSIAWRAGRDYKKKEEKGEL